MKTAKANNELLMESLSRAHFQYFVDYQNKSTGLILDRTRPGAPATIAGVGFALPAYAAASERNWISRQEALDYTLKVLRLLHDSPQGEAAQGVSGYRGFFYHFLDPNTGLRATAPQFWHSELSSIDTALLMAGVRFAAAYYRGRRAEEREIRRLAEALYERVEWNWLLRENGEIGHGWTPENGLIKSVYSGYSEALLLYILALGSKRYAVPAQSWQALCSRYITADKPKKHISMPGMPLFCYQYPHCFIDFRGIKDKANRQLGFDYFENSKRAVLAHHAYAVENKKGFVGYGPLQWGLTACDGPGPMPNPDEKTGSLEFRHYSERGITGFDDGTIAPTAALASLPFKPALVLRTARHWLNKPGLYSLHGFADAFNASYGIASGQEKNQPWIADDRLAIDQGPVVLMFENHRSDFVWRHTRRDPVLRKALTKAGFKGGWLKH